MSKLLKIILLAVGGLVGLLVVVAVVLLLFVDANAYKAQMEAAASRALGMEVSIDGGLGVSFFSGLLVTMDDVHIRNRGLDVAAAKGATIGIGLFDLLRRKVSITTITLKHPEISIERDHAGKFNFEQPEAAGGTLPALDLPKVSILDGTFRYRDEQSGQGFEASDCSLEVSRLRLSGGQSPDPMRNVSFTAELACGEARQNDFALSDLKLSASGKNGIYDLNPVTMRLFGAQGSGRVQADYSSVVPFYRITYSLPQFNIEEFFKTLSPQKVAEGPMDFSADLSMQGKTVREMRQTVKGQILLRGQNLTVIGRDLDEELSRFESSQNFNLVDVGAFFFAGPVGLMVTKGYNFASIFQGSGGTSEIRTLVSDWKVERGVAHARDVAMATKENRIALRGGLDLVSERFDDVTVALIDAEGCATVKQTIHGAFHDPVVEKPSVLKSLTGPVLDLLKKGRALFPGGECEAFYVGSVAPPE